MTEENKEIEIENKIGEKGKKRGKCRILPHVFSFFYFLF